MLFFCLSQPKIATVSRTSEKALKKQHFISLIKMWIFEKFNKEKNMEKTEKVNQYFTKQFIFIKNQHENNRKIAVWENK